MKDNVKAHLRVMFSQTLRLPLSLSLSSHLFATEYSDIDQQPSIPLVFTSALDYRGPQCRRRPPQPAEDSHSGIPPRPSRIYSRLPQPFLHWSSRRRPSGVVETFPSIIIHRGDTSRANADKQKEGFDLKLHLAPSANEEICSAVTVVASQSPHSAKGFLIFSCSIMTKCSCS